MNHRERYDIHRLMNRYKVKCTKKEHVFLVLFKGPVNTVYEGGKWTVQVVMSKDYPYSPPHVIFLNRIYHPNIDPSLGTICVDVLNKKWSALFNLCNIFDLFLPQLLTYPNADDPLNCEAGFVYKNKPQLFERTVKEYIEIFASESKIKENSVNSYESDEDSSNEIESEENE